MPSSRPEGPATQSDHRLLALTALAVLEDLLRSEIHAAVREVVDELTDRPLVYSADQAAKVLAVSRRTIETWVADGVLRRMPHTGRLLIPRVSVEEFVRNAAS